MGVCGGMNGVRVVWVLGVGGCVGVHTVCVG